MFFSCVAGALEEQIPEELRMIVAVPEENGATLIGLDTEDDPSAIAALDQLIAQRPAALAAALAVEWAPGDVDPVEPAWLVIVVVPGRTAQFSVRRRTEQQWWRLRPTTVPWLALSTAGSLRAALEQGKPLVIKVTKDKRLFNLPGHGAMPPTDSQGLM